MNHKPLLRVLAAALGLAASALVGGCAKPSYDYTNFRAAKPRSILILPPVNDSTEVIASNSVLSTMTLPLAEAGYYVMPVTVVDETFKQNGLYHPAEIVAVPPAKLRQIFGADAALYVQIKEYGTSYIVISSSTVVTVEARLVDLRSGTLLWKGSATANNAETDTMRFGGGGGGIIGMLVAAVVNQIVQQATDTSHKVATLSSARLLAPGAPAGILYGPRSPKYEGR